MSNRDSCFTTANSHARFPGKPRYAFKDVTNPFMRCQPGGGQRHFGVREVREFDSRLGRSAEAFVLTVCAGSPPRSRVLFPFPGLSRGRRARLGCGRPCAHATMGSDGSQKNGRTCGEIGASAQLSGHPERREQSGRGSGARRGRTNPARGWIRTASEPRRQLKARGNRWKRAAGYYEDRMRRWERATVPSGSTSAGWWAGEEECTSPASAPFI